MVLPAGISLLDNGQYKVGNLISKGAFGAVYTVVTKGGQVTEWAVKAVPVPVKVTKKMNTAPEIAHRLLWHENLLYTQHFVKYCGTLLPTIPRRHLNEHGLDTFIDNRNGYRFLVMERMVGTLFESLPEYVHEQQQRLAATVTSTTTAHAVDIGAIAVKLIQIVEALHSCQHLIVDVKPENIMIAPSPATKNRKGIPFSDRIRLLDMGLVKCYLGPNGHKVNDGIKEVVGTPQYASLNIHALESPSRRDDIESIIYLVGELVLRVSAIMENTVNTYEVSSSNGVHATYLPWSNATSDEQVGKIKLEHVSKISSEYYQRMPTSVATTLMDCWNEVRSYEFTAKPKYKLFCDLLSTLTMPFPKKNAPPSAVPCKPKEAKSRAVKAKPSIPVSDRKVVKRMTRSSSKTPGLSKNPSSGSHEATEFYDAVQGNVHEENQDYEINDWMDVDNGDEVDNSFHTAPSIANSSFHSTLMSPTAPVECMMMTDSDVEYCDLYPPAPLLTSIKIGQVGLKICLVLPNKKCKSIYYLVKGVTESIIIGSNPVASNTKTTNVCVPGDLKLKPSHVQLTFLTTRSVNVTDLSGGFTTVMNMKVPKSGTSVFAGQEVNLGKDCNIEILPVDKKDYVNIPSPELDIENCTASHHGATKSASTKPSSSRSRPNRSAMAVSDDNVSARVYSPTGTELVTKNNPVITNTSGSRSDSRITVKVEGYGDFVLQEGLCTTYVVGSNPTPKAGASLIVLPQSKGILPNHAKLDLHVRNGVLMVKVTDVAKKVPGDFVLQVDQRQVAAGKNIMAFRGAQIAVGSVTMQI